MDQTPYYLTFQRQLRASEQITAFLAPALQHVHWLYEGWNDDTLPHPLEGELLRLYSEAACYMVRFCSTPERVCAENRSKRWAVMQLPTFLKQLTTAKPEALEGLVTDFVSTVLDIHRGALMQGVEVMTPQENILQFELEADDDARRI